MHEPLLLLVAASFICSMIPVTNQYPFMITQTRLIIVISSSHLFLSEGYLYRFDAMCTQRQKSEALREGKSIG
jgi:hypothetical protein